jgi:hypothetical protein
MIWFVQDDIVLGKKLATGGFGSVYRGFLNTVDGGQLPIIVKKVRPAGLKQSRAGPRGLHAH